MWPVAGTRNEQRPARRRQQLGRAGEEIGLDQVGRPADDEPGHGRDVLDHGRATQGKVAVVADRALERGVAGQRLLRATNALVALGPRPARRPAPVQLVEVGEIAAPHGSLRPRGLQRQEVPPRPQRRRRAPQQARVRDRQRHDRADPLGRQRRRDVGDQRAPVMADEHRPLRVDRVQQLQPVVPERLGVIAATGDDRVGVIAAQPRDGDAPPRAHERGLDARPRVRRIGKAVQEHDVRALARHGDDVLSPATGDRAELHRRQSTFAAASRARGARSRRTGPSAPIGHATRRSRQPFRARRPAAASERRRSSSCRRCGSDRLRRTRPSRNRRWSRSYRSAACP